MERVTQTQQTLDRLCLQVGDSSILPVVLPLFETLNYQDDYYPNRTTERNGDAQLFWELREVSNNNFERLCLTLSKHTLSLTIALDHQRSSSYADLPVIHTIRTKAPLRSTMLIDTHGHTLYESNPHNGVLVGTHYNNEAITQFAPKLAHTMTALGLYEYGQNVQQEVS
jgi:hypothetical protein